MKIHTLFGKWPGAPLAVLLALAVAVPAALGQSTTVTIRGRVVDDSGPLPGATVEAVSTASGFVHRSITDADGGFALGALTPGSYEVRVQMEGFKPQARTLQVLLGQNPVLEFRLTLDAMVLENITVIGDRTQLLVDLKTAEIRTNVTQEQINLLPQNSRNFLNFAALAPGVYVNPDPNATQNFRSGGMSSRQVNTFIDGLSYKNDLLEGGSFMQDSSKGNPFPQNAVQEFQVLTQNYKAEYEKAAAAIISAITRSGGNRWSGDAFYFFQNKSMVALDPISEEKGFSKPEYKRNQLGLAVGGPLLKDTLHAFVSYERNSQDRYNLVTRGGQWNDAPANVKAKLSAYAEGNIKSPFTSDLYFAKLTWQPAVSQTVDISYNRRDEEEIRGFGGQRVEEGAESFQVATNAAVAKWTGVFGNSTLNEASLTFQQLRWFPTAFRADLPRLNYIGLLDVGGKDGSQDFQQDRVGLRDDLTYYLSWLGDHAVKGGVTANFMDYTIKKNFYSNPTYEFRSDEQWQYPFKARYGFGNAKLSYDNTQVGVYLQDDWRITPTFALSVGLRWDYESNMLNNDFVTPPALLQAMSGACRTYGAPVGGKTRWCLNEFLDFSQYTTDGNDRKPYYGMVQPRLGFTWDVTGKGETVLFGGWGKYYDRVLLNDIFDEQYRQQYKIYEFCFSADGTPRPGCGVPPIVWKDSYLSRGALDQLISSGQAPGPEIFLVNNEMRPPRSDQWTLGARQRLFGSYVVGLSYAGVRGYNGMAWFFGDLPPGTTFGDRWGGNVPIPGYARLFITSDVRKTKYDAVFLTIDRPFTTEAGWGFNLAYTRTDAKSTGPANAGDGIAWGAFDFLRPSDFTWHRGDYDEKDRIVASGTVGLPFGFRVSTILTLGSGLPYTIYDASKGWDKFTIDWNAGSPRKYVVLGWKNWAYRSLDLRLEWETKIAGDFRFGLVGEGFNVTDFANYACYGWGSGFKPPAGETNSQFGKGECAINARRFQVGAKFSF